MPVLIRAFLTQKELSGAVLEHLMQIALASALYFAVAPKVFCKPGRNVFITELQRSGGNGFG